MIQWVFIPLEPYCFQRKKLLKGALLLMTLMNDKYLLHIINEIISVVGFLRNFLYIYKCRKIITSDIDN